MTYDPYSSIPPDLRPTTSDGYALFEIAVAIKLAVKIRHDFHTAIHISDMFANVRGAFVPSIVSQPGSPAERHLGPPQAWESDFAQSARPDAKKPAGLAGEHMRLANWAKSLAAKVHGNPKLAKLIKGNLEAFFPDIGYSPATGSVLRRLRKDDRSVLQAFHPLGVEDQAKIIRLLLERKRGMYYYW